MNHPELRGFAAMPALLLAACAGLAPETDGPAGPPRPEHVIAVTADAQVIRFNAGQPQRVLARAPLQGLPAGDRLVGIDFRMSRGVLFALSASGRVYTLDATSGRLTPVGNATGTGLQFGAQPVGFDFNPVADRLRVVAADGRNWRLHPDTGALVMEDAPLRYEAADAGAGQRPRLAGAGYTYNKTNDKLTTNYALDLARGTLVRQGSLEGATPVVSPNTGQLATVGALGTGALDDAAFDISDLNNAALAALSPQGRNGRTELHAVDLASGKATRIGRIDRGQPLWGLAIEP